MKTTKTTNRKTKLLYALVLLAVMAACAPPAEGAIAGEPSPDSPAPAPAAADANGASPSSTTESNTESGYFVTLTWVSFYLLEALFVLAIATMGITKRLNYRLEKTYSSWLSALYICLLVLLSVSMFLYMAALNPTSKYWVVFQFLFILVLAFFVKIIGLPSSQKDIENADKLIKGIWSFARRIVKEDKAGVLAKIMDLQPSCNYQTLYFLSIEAGSVNCFKVLVDSDGLKSSENIWPRGLHHALEHTNLNTPQIVEILLVKDKNIVNEKGGDLTDGTALHILMLQWKNISKPLRSRLLEILLKHGADPSIKDDYGKTPLDVVLSYGAGMDYDEAKPLIAGAAAASEQKDGSVSTDSEQKLPDTGIAAEQHEGAASADSKKGEEEK